MVRAYVDESYGPDDYYVAGIVLTDPQYARMARLVADVREFAVDAFGVPEDVEFHGHRLMQACSHGVAWMASCTRP